MCLCPSISRRVGVERSSRPHGRADRPQSVHHYAHQRAPQRRSQSSLAFRRAAVAVTSTARRWWGLKGRWGATPPSSRARRVFAAVARVTPRSGKNARRPDRSGKSAGESADAEEENGTGAARRGARMSFSTTIGIFIRGTPRQSPAGGPRAPRDRAVVRPRRHAERHAPRPRWP